MRVSLAVIALALAVSGTAAPLMAQQTPNPTPTGSSLGSNPVSSQDSNMRYPNQKYFEREFDMRRLVNGEVDGSDYYSDAMGVANCLYASSDGKVSPLVGGPLSDDPGYSHLSKAMRKSSACLRGTNPAIAFFVGAALAEKSVLAEHVSLPPRAMTLNMDVAEPFYTPASGSLTIDHVGRCLAVFSPGLAEDVLKTKVGSESEKSALDKAYSSTPECGVSKAPEKIPALMQRAAIAYGLEAWMRESAS